MDYLFFAGYLILFSWLVTKTGFFTKSGLSKPQLVIIFLLKVIAGIFYGWMGHFYGGFAQMIDTWNYHNNGLTEYHLLQTNPQEYLTNIFHDPYNKEGVESFFGSKDSYWNDLKGNVFTKLVSIFHILSFGQYYINVIFYAFLSLFGPIAIYRVMLDVFPDRKQILLLAIFFTPSFLYWSSGIHKEGLIFTGVALITYHVYYGFKENRFTIRRWLAIFLGLSILLLLRNFVLVIILPALLAWVLANKWPRYSLVCYASVYLFCLVSFFTLRYLDTRLDFPQAVVSKQQAFIQNVGKSSVPIKELKPTALSFLKSTPQAISLSMVRPYPGDVKHLLSLAAAVETDLLLLLFFLFLLYRRKEKLTAKNFTYFCVFFSLTLFLAIGFSVNNLGAIVRYRSIVLPLIIPLIAVQTDWRAITNSIAGKNKKNLATNL